MSARLEKLYDHLQADRYEMILEEFERQDMKSEVSTLNSNMILKVARAYYVLENYDKCRQLCENILMKNKPEIWFEATMLLLKAKYLLGQHAQFTLNSAIEFVNKNSKGHYNQFHLRTLQEFADQVRISFGSVHKPQKDEKAGLMDIISTHEKAGPLIEGIPMFIISARWLRIWMKYLDEKGSAPYPGPVAQFEILDHFYYANLDCPPEKAYTKFFLFNRLESTMVVPQKAWEFLKGRYGGTAIKRYNVSHPKQIREISTEINLRRILIELQGANTIRDEKLLLQLSRRCTIAFLTSYVDSLLGQKGTLLIKDQKNHKAVNLSVSFDDLDINTEFVYDTSNLSKIDKGPRCSNLDCKKATQLKKCKCKLVRYCSMTCLKANYERHRPSCEFQCNKQTKMEAMNRDVNFEEADFGGNKGVVGLRNLGNTCYMNSGIQCLSNTEELTLYFMSKQFTEHINYSNNLGTKGALACAYAQGIRAMWAGSDSVVSLFKLKKVMGEFATQFAGYGQQDSQQFISYLIDGLQEDLNLIHEKQAFETPDDIVSDHEGSERSERNFAKRIRSYIRDIMVGQFKSTVSCLTCKKVSVCFDPFMLISLPIPSFRNMKLFLVPQDPSLVIQEVAVICENQTTVEQIRSLVIREYLTPKETVLFCSVHAKSFQILKTFNDPNQTVLKMDSDLKDNYLIAYAIPIKLTKVARYDLFHQSRISFPRYIFGTQQGNIAAVRENVRTLFSRKNKNGAANFDFDYRRDITQQCEAEDSDKIPYTKIVCRTQFPVTNYKIAERSLSTRRQDITLDSCLNNFTNKELLEKQNSWRCKNCKDFVVAEKEMEIYKANKILVLVFKRFNRFRKTSDRVAFPTSGLNMGPYLKSKVQSKTDQQGQMSCYF